MQSRFALRSNRVGVLVIALAVTVSLGACAEEPQSPPPSPAGEPAQGGAASPAGPRTLDPAQPTAKITGKTSYRGDAPEVRRIPMSADPYCEKANEGGVSKPPFEVGADGALPSTFVYVSKGLEGYSFSAPTEPVRLDQKGCVYEPAVFGVQVGQPLEIRNSDATLHNVHAVGKKAGNFNIGMPKQGMTTVRKFATPEVFVRFKCDVHPWMAASAGVVDNPFYAVTGADGSFTLEGLPAGEYTIHAVHPALGAHVETIRLEPPADATVTFEFSD